MFYLLNSNQEKLYCTKQDGYWYIFIVIGYIDFPSDAYTVHNLFLWVHPHILSMPCGMHTGWHTCVSFIWLSRFSFSADATYMFGTFVLLSWSICPFLFLQVTGIMPLHPQMRCVWWAKRIFCWDMFTPKTRLYILRFCLWCTTLSCEPTTVGMCACRPDG